MDLNNLQDVHKLFSKNSLQEALELIQKKHNLNIDSEVLIIYLKVCYHWLDENKKLNRAIEISKEGENYYNEIIGYCTQYLSKTLASFKGNFIPKLSYKNKDLEQSIETGVYKCVLQHYTNLFFTCKDQNLENIKKNELLIKIAKLYKFLGEYDNSLIILEEMLSEERHNADCMMQLADCYELIGEDKKAKLFFREAFYLGTEFIDFDSVVSSSIPKLDKKIREDKGFALVSLIREWMPVYAIILGIFNVKRELKSAEISNLKQDVFKMKNELKSLKGYSHSPILPRLLFYYFILIDHYLIYNKDDRKKVEDLLLNIKELDPNIYQQFAN